jgi:hypothetical protein
MADTIAGRGSACRPSAIDREARIWPNEKKCGPSCGTPGLAHWGLKQNHPNARCNLGVIVARQGAPEAAIEQQRIRIRRRRP